MSAIGIDPSGSIGRLDRGIATYAAPMTDQIGVTLIDDGLVAKAVGVHLAAGRTGRSACGMLYPGKTSRSIGAVTCGRCKATYHHAGALSRAGIVDSRSGPFGPFGKAMPLKHKVVIGAGATALATGAGVGIHRRVKARRWDRKYGDEFSGWLDNTPSGRKWNANPVGSPPANSPGFGKIDTTMSPEEARRHVAEHGAVGPLPKHLDRATRLKVHEARYIHHGGPKGERWQHRADTADKVTVGALGLGGTSALTELAARVKHSHRLSQVAATGGLTAAGVGAASELSRRFAERRRSSYAHAPAGVAASSLRRMRDMDSAKGQQR